MTPTSPIGRRRFPILPGDSHRHERVPDRTAEGDAAHGGRKPHASNERPLLVALAVCCVVPMLAIIVLTSVVGVAVGPAVAVSLGLVAAMVCVAVMVQHHRVGEPKHGDHLES